MPALNNRVAISISREIDLRMIQHLAHISGQSVSSLCGLFLSEYLQHNYLRLQEFYSKAHNCCSDYDANPDAAAHVKQMFDDC